MNRFSTEKTNRCLFFNGLKKRIFQKKMNFTPKISSVNGERRIFDPIRKKYVALTPEELVRQGFIHFLTSEKGFPAGLLMVEYALKVNGLTRRCDIVACNRAGAPLLLVECKAPSVKLDNETFAQAARYNLTLRVPYLAITNGDDSYCCTVDFKTGKVLFLRELPRYGEMTHIA